MISLHRGLTLLEVLLASAILAMLAAACAPILARATGLFASVEPTRAIDVRDVADAADQIVANPDLVGIGSDGRPPLHAISVMEVQWPTTEGKNDHQLGPPIRIRRLPASELDHAWIAFECESVTVCRWTSIPDGPSLAGGER